MAPAFRYLSVLLLLLPLPAASQVPFALNPSWTSADVQNYSTGAAWVDINGDGWLDLVVSNGNDMARQHVAVYLNDGKGHLPLRPDWESADVDYHGHLAVADVNKDGWPDVAVSVYIGPIGFGQRGKVKLYLNNHGALGSLPAWSSKDTMYTFSCSFGDADGDGWPDLAVACGESYEQRPEQNRIYFNHGGKLDSLPGWMSASPGYSIDAAWLDVNRDGYLDLVFAGEGNPNQLYLNGPGGMGTAPAWNSSGTGDYANSLFPFDATRDGAIDLALSDNNQLGGDGKFKLYVNEQDMLKTGSSWSSLFSGYGSAITAADLDGDGWKDLVTGGWWNPVRIYMNTQADPWFPAAPNWSSNTASVVEAIALGDVDNDGLDTLMTMTQGDGVRKLFYLPFAPIQRILTAFSDQDTIPSSTYCADLEQGWISFGQPPRAAPIRVRMVCSHDLDMAVTNWDPTIGNYLFLNTTPPTPVERTPAPVESPLRIEMYPSPLLSRATIRVSMPGRAGIAGLRVYDLLGRAILDLTGRLRSAGSGGWEAHLFRNDFPAPGVYLCRATGPEFSTVKKILVSE